MAATYNRNVDDTVAVQDQESNSGQKKYGEIMPKKKPLISKNHERAFFDSADWALCKQQAAGVDPISSVYIENLQPKLQRTPHQQLPPRRPTCTWGRDGLISSSN
ncbi:Endosulphine [Heracleum sosnowskyi]|uniref:Endosulphine n=1 Tax=Heracleum sosnowskyi TaxID=360622 RepID=A0AAD8MPT7_9APIA|nr:Endosulphine [Heracleum sosnowskyi]